MSLLLPNKKSPKDKTLIIILSAPRTGSTYLSSLLDSHNKLLILGEIFNNQRIKTHGKLSELDAKNDLKTLNRRDKNPVKFLKKELVSNTLDNQIIGFKIIYEQLSLENIDKLMHTFNCKIIHLKRKNYLDILVSLKLAKETNKWVKLSSNKKSDYIKHDWDNEVDFKNTSDDNITIRINIPATECLDFFNHLEKNEEEHTNFLIEKPVHTVYYEDLINHANEVHSSLLEYIGVKQTPLSAITLKQKLHPNSEIITNYNELKNEFKHTKWSNFFM
jgi:LPS sulfotransferase NodH